MPSSSYWSDLLPWALGSFRQGLYDDLELIGFDAPRVDVSTVRKDARRGQQRAGKPFDTGQRKPAEWENPKQVEKEEKFGPL